MDPGATFSCIGDLRRELAQHVYLQVTATPQALFLQTLDDPCKPQFCVLSNPGEGYIGGRDFFADGSRLLCEVDPHEFDDLRSGRVVVGRKSSAPRSLRDALAVFFLGCAQKRLEHEDLANFSFLAHVAITKVTHEHLRDVINTHVTWLDQALRGRHSESDRKAAEADLVRGYEELRKTARNLAPLKDLRTYVERVLRNVRAEIINSDTEGMQVRYRPGPNIFVGGNRLSRGVRIDNLMVTYYGREAKARMMDTVHQHARMFGYRRRLLDTTRFFSTRPILDAFRLICEADEAMRDAVGDDPTELDIKPVWVGKKLQPTRANVLNPFELGVMVPGRAIYPWCPKYKTSEIKHLTAQLDSLLEGYEDGEFYTVDVSFLQELLRLMPSESEPGHLWEDARVQEVLEQMQSDVLRIRRGRLHVKRGKGDGFRVTRVDKGPTDTGFGDDITAAKQQFPSVPTLLLRRQAGLKGRNPEGKQWGWDGCPFYAPTLVLPNGRFAFMFSNV